jgi:anti-anti-sigma regulatory factor
VSHRLIDHRELGNRDVGVAAGVGKREGGDVGEEHDRGHGCADRESVRQTDRLEEGEADRSDECGRRHRNSNDDGEHDAPFDARCRLHGDQRTQPSLVYTTLSIDFLGYSVWSAKHDRSDARSHALTELEIWLHGDDRHAVVRLRGRLDDTSTSFAGRVLHDLLADPEGAADIEVHLDEVSAYDETAARVLLRMADEAARAHRRITMFGLPPYLTAILGRRAADQRQSKA